MTVDAVGENSGIALGDLNPEELRENQAKDPELRWVVLWRKTGEEPPEGDLFLANAHTKFYWVNREMFVLGENQVLYKDEDDQGPRRVVVPKGMRGTLLQLCHDVPLAGHQGVTRTLERLKQGYFWRGMKGRWTTMLPAVEVVTKIKSQVVQPGTL